MGRLFFVNGQRVADKLRPMIAEAQARVVVLDLSAVFDVEYTVLKMLAEGEERMRGARRLGLARGARAGGARNGAALAVWSRHRAGLHVLQSRAGGREAPRR